LASTESENHTTEAEQPRGALAERVGALVLLRKPAFQLVMNGFGCAWVGVAQFVVLSVRTARLVVHTSSRSLFPSSRCAPYLTRRCASYPRSCAPATDPHRPCATGISQRNSEYGQVFAPLPPWLRRLRTSLRSITFDIEADELVIGLPGGVDAVVELGVAPTRAADPLAGRSVVYLDQNHWSALAAWRHGHRRIAPAEATAADRLAELVDARTVVLPISGAHAVETGPLYNAPRVALASTLLELSHGWQLRNPAHVRAQELRAALASAPPVAASVTSLGADMLFTRRMSPVDRSDLPDLPGFLSAAMPRIVNVLSIYEALVSPTAVPDEGGREASVRWAGWFADLASHLRDVGATREGCRRAAHGAMLTDLAPELVQMAPEPALQAWLKRSEADVAAMPYLSRYRAVIFARLSNANARWTGNDFTDLNYLCCAAGYADVVVGERRTIGDLRTARGVPAGAALATTLSEAVALLDQTR
jgi:hypothetical protein